MSTSIDQRVVEMQFDNAQFESGVKTSLSTLEKLKKALDLDGASKGLEDVSSKVNSFNMDHMSDAVDKVGEKFNALETIAVGALLRIGSTAVDAGAKFIKSLSIDNVADGFQKFSDKTQSVMTLIAQGYSADDVDEAMERLNWFTDETSFNFTDMVDNISKFTAAGQDLEPSVTAMEGIANWASLSGQNITTASRAMYQLSQAMGKGVLKFDDWKSIQTANMDTMEFRKNAVGIAEDLGKVKKVVGEVDGEMVDLYQVMSPSGKIHEYTLAEMFTSDALSKDRWFDSDVMMGTFSKYASAVNDIYEAVSAENSEYETASEAIEALRGELDAFGIKAFEASQQARSWEDVVGSVKDAVSTGWMTTFELLIGKAEEATEVFTWLANELYDVFALGGNWRNDILREWLSLGGRDELLEAGENLYYGFRLIFDPIKKGLRAGFGIPDDWDEGAEFVGQKLYEFTVKIREFTRAIAGDGSQWYKFGAAAEAVGTTFRVLANALKNVVQFISPVVKPIRALIDLVLRLIVRIGNFVGFIDESARSSEGFTSTLEMMAESFNMVMSSIAFVIDHLELFIFLLPKIIEIVARNFAPVFEDAADAVINLFEPLAEFLDGKMGNGWRKIGELISDIFSGKGINIEAFQSVKDSFEKLFDTIQKSRAVKVFLDILKTIAMVIGGLIISIPILIGFIGNNLINAITIAGTAFSKFYETVHNFIKGKFDKAFSGFSKTFEKFGKIFTDIFAGKKKIDIKLYKELKDCILEIVEQIKNSEKIQKITTFINNIIESVQNGWAKVKDFFSSIGESFSENGLLGIFSTVKDKIVEIFSDIKDSLSGLADTEIFKQLFGSIDDEAKTDSIGKISESLKEFANNLSLGKIGAIAFFLSLIGLMNAMSGMLGSFKGVASTITDFFGGATLKTLLGVAKKKSVLIDFAIAVAAVALSLAALAKVAEGGHLKEATQSLVTVVAVIGGFAVLLELLSKFETKAVSKKTSGIGLAVAGIAASLLIAVYALDKLRSINISDYKQLAINIGIIAVLMLGLVGIAKLMGKTNAGARRNALVIVAIAASLYIVARSLTDLANTDPEGIKAATLGMLEVIAGLALISFAIKGLTLVSPISLLLLIAILTKTLPQLEEIAGKDYPNIRKVIEENIDLVKQLGILALVMSTVASVIGKGVDQFGSGVGKIVLSIAGIAAVAYIIGKLNPAAMKRGTKFVFSAILLLGVLGLLLKNSKKNRFSPDALKNFGKSMMALGFGVIELGIAVRLLANMSDQQIKTGLKVVGALIGMLSIFMILSGVSARIAGENKGGGLTGVTKLIYGVAAMAVAMIVLSFIPIDQLKNGMIAVAFLTAMLSALMLSMSVLAKNMKVDSIKTGILTLLTTVGALAAVVVALWFLSKQSWQGLIAGAVALGIVFMALSKSLYVLTRTSEGKSFTSAKNKNFLWKTLVPMGAMLLGAVLALRWLADQPWQGLLAGAVALGIVLTALAYSVSMLVYSPKGVSFAKADNWGFIFKNLVFMAVMLGGATAALWFLAKQPWQGMIAGAIALGGLLIALSFAMKIMTTGSAFLTLPTTLESLLIMAGFLIGGVLALRALADQPWQGMIAGAVSLSILAIGLSGALVILSLLGVTALNAIPSILVIALVLGGIGAIAGLIGENLSPEMQGVIMQGLDFIGQFLVKLAEILAQCLTALFSDLPSLAEYLTQFAEGLSPFFDAISGYKDSSQAVNDLVDCLGILFALFVGYEIEQLLQKIPILGKLLGNSSGFVQHLTDLGSALAGFSSAVAGKVDPEAVGQAAAAGAELAKMQGLIENDGGLVGKIVGNNNWELFQKGLATFGKALADFQTNASGVTVEGIGGAVEAATELAKLQGLIENDGGIVGKIVGNNNWETFQKGLATFGKALAEFQTNTEGVTADNIKNAVEAGVSLAELQAVIENDGGLVGEIVGNNNWETFQKGLATFGTALKQFQTNSTGVTAEGVKGAVEAGTELAGLASIIDDLRPVITFFGVTIAPQTLSTFGDNLKDFGSALLTFNVYAQNIDTDALKSVSSALSAIVGLSSTISSSDMSKRGAIFGGNALEDFGKNLGDLATKLNDFAVKIEGFDTEKITSIGNDFKNLVDVVSSIGTVDMTNVNNFATDLGSISTQGITNFFLAFQNSSSTVTSSVGTLVDNITNELRVNRASDFTNVGKDVVDLILNNMDSESNESGSDSGKLLAEQFVKGLNDNLTSDLMTSAAEAAISGFTSQINAKVSDVYNAGQNMGNQFIEGFRSSTGWNSPWLTMVASANDCVLGFTSTIALYYKTFENSGFTMGDAIVQGYRDGLDWHSNPPWTGESVQDTANSTGTEFDKVMPFIYQKAKEYGLEIPEGVADGINNNMSLITNAIGSAGQQIQNEINGVLDLNANDLSNYLSGYSTVQDLYNHYMYGQEPHHQYDLTQNMPWSDDAYIDYTNEQTDATNGLTDALNQNTGAAGSNAKAKGGSGKASKEAAKEARAHEKAMKAQTEATALLTEYLMQANSALDDTSAAEQAKSAMEELARVYGTTAEDILDSNINIEEAFQAMFEEISGTIESSIDLFEEFDVAVSGRGSDLVKNMRSQFEGVNTFADRILMLAQRGFSREIVESFAKEGPKSLSKVNQFLKTSFDEQLEIMDGYKKKTEAAFNASVKIIAAMAYATQTQEAIAQVAAAGSEDQLAALQRNVLEVQAEITKIQVVYDELKSTVKDVVESQMDIFTKFEMKTEMTSGQVLENMRSQLDGIRSWGANMVTIIQKSSDAGFGDRSAFIQNLAEMGPKSYELVNAIASMTSEEFASMASMWDESLALPDEISQMVGDSYFNTGMSSAMSLLEGYNSQIETIRTSAQLMGENLNQGTIQGLTLTQGELNTTVQTMQEGAQEVARSVNGIASPSTVYAEIGRYIVLGEMEGIDSMKGILFILVRLIGTTMLNDTKNILKYLTFFDIGRNIMVGLADGIRANAFMAAQAMFDATNSVVAASRAAAEVNSPSRITYEIGKYISQGLAIGIREDTPVAVSNAEYMARSVLAAINGDLVDGLDGGLQPVITPVLDLSDVQNGMRDLGSILNGRSSYMMHTGRLGAISPSDNGFSSLAAAINGHSGNSSNAYNITINTQPGQNSREIADMVIKRLDNSVTRRRAAYS